MLKGGIIGFGNIVQSNHIKAFSDKRFYGRAEIKAVAEPNLKNRKLSEEKFPQLKFYSSAVELLKNENLDFVDIAAPPKFHYDLLKLAVSHNLHIICEKPFTLKLEEAGEIRQLLLNYKKVFIPSHQYRYLKIYQAFKTEINKMKPGNKVLLRFNVYRTKADPGLAIFNNPWRINPSIGGGGIIADTGVHYLYLSNWLLEKPLKITAVNFTLSHSEYKVEDTAIITIEFEKGVSQITLTWGGNARLNSSELISKNCSISYLGGEKFEKTVNSKIEKFNVPNFSDKRIYIKLYYNLFSDFFNKIENNLDSKKEILEAFNSIKLLNSCYISANRLKTISLK